MSTKIIDLEKDSDGEYTPKRAKDKGVPKEYRGTGLVRTPKGEKPRYMRENHADEFLNGIDVGLDLIEKVMPRLDRFLRLRG